MPRALFGDKEPLGRYVARSADNAGPGHSRRQMEIIGIVRSPHEAVFENAPPLRLYVPLGQRARDNIFLHVKLADPDTMPLVLDRLRHTIAAAEPDVPILLAQPLADFIDKNITLRQALLLWALRQYLLWATVSTLGDSIYSGLSNHSPRLS